MNFSEGLYQAFEVHVNAEDARHMKAYMKDKFEFFGIKAKKRREIFKEYTSSKSDILKTQSRALAKELYASEMREMHMCAIEIVARYCKRKYKEEDLDFIEFLICTNSWWDSVDFIAKQILGQYLIEFPGMTKSMLERFGSSDNMWLNRSTILFQLGYKSKTNEQILYDQCQKFSESTEFFIQKAIGWSLREYAKINPSSVLNFVNSVSLKPLSRREAIRNIVLNE